MNNKCNPLSVVFVFFVFFSFVVTAFYLHLCFYVYVCMFADMYECFFGVV